MERDRNAQHIQAPLFRVPQVQSGVLGFFIFIACRSTAVGGGGWTRVRRWGRRRRRGTLLTIYMWSTNRSPNLKSERLGLHLIDYIDICLEETKLKMSRTTFNFLLLWDRKVSLISISDFIQYNFPAGKSAQQRLKVSGRGCKSSRRFHKQAFWKRKLQCSSSIKKCCLQGNRRDEWKIKGASESCCPG